MAEIRVAVARKADAQHAIKVDQAHKGEMARPKYLREIAHRGGLYLAYRGPDPVGFGCLDSRIFFHAPFVSLLVVHPEFRRMGAGRALMERLQAEAAGQRLFTSTNLSNAPMIALLRDSGFVLCGQVTGLDEGDPELIYSKNL